jgi:hypothetical protein
MTYSKVPAFINRTSELAFLKGWIAEKPENILFMYGPKSGGKTTLLYKFVTEHLSDGRYDLKHINLREILINQYQDFVRAFFEHDYSKEKEDVKEKREYNLHVFKLTVEAFKGVETKELDPFVIMKAELRKLVAHGIRPVIIIDELQALEGIYLNGQREILKELFNFFVAMTKEAHLCHVIIASSDGYFIDRIYNDSKLKKTSQFLEVEYLQRDDVFYWLNHLERESGITRYTLTPEQIDAIWETFGGSCWEISRFLGDILLKAEKGVVPDEAFSDIRNRTLIQMRSMYADYAKIFPEKRALLRTLAAVVAQHGKFREEHLGGLVEQGIWQPGALVDELDRLVSNNFIAYNPVTAEYAVQGRSMELGLQMYVEMISVPTQLLG